MVHYCSGARCSFSPALTNAALTSAITAIGGLIVVFFTWLIAIHWPDRERAASEAFLDAISPHNVEKLQNVCADYPKTKGCERSEGQLILLKRGEKSVLSVLNVDFGAKCDFYTLRKYGPDNSADASDQFDEPTKDKEVDYTSPAVGSKTQNLHWRFHFQIDSKKAIKACALAVESDKKSARFAYQLALAHHAKPDFDEAKSWYEKAAELGSGRAYQALGFLYSSGSLGERDLNEAVRWLENGAMEKLPEPSIALARFLHRGIGVPKDRQRALDLLDDFYGKKSNLAAYELGEFHEFEKSYHEADGYYEDAADWGYSDGLVKRAILKTNGKLGPKSAAWDKIALGFLEDAIHATDNPWAYHYKAWLIEQGRAGDIAPEKAIEFYEKATKRKYSYSARNLGNIYRYGHLGQEKDPGTAFDHYSDAAEWGDVDGYLKSADMLVKGEYSGKSDSADKRAYDLIDTAVKKPATQVPNFIGLG